MEPSPQGSPRVTAPAEETPPPELQSPSLPTGSELTPTLEDFTGLATEVVAVAPPLPFEEGLTHGDPGSPSLLVSWFGSPCELEPTIRVDGAAADLSVTVYRGLVQPGECPASQAHRTVRLGLTAEIELGNASLTVMDGAPPG